MKLFTKLLSTSFLFASLLLCLPSIPHVFAQSATSGCVKTIIGNPDPNQKLPGGCGGGGNQRVIEMARAQLGDPYIWAAPPTRPNWAAAGPNPPSFDCSGLVGWSWHWGTDGKVNFPASTRATWRNMPADKFQIFTRDQLAEIQPADAIYFGPNDGGVHHTGLYVGQGACGKDDCFIEAQQSGVPVKETSLSSRKDVLGFYRPINF